MAIQCLHCRKWKGRMKKWFKGNAEELVQIRRGKWEDSESDNRHIRFRDEETTSLRYNKRFKQGQWKFEEVLNCRGILILGNSDTLNVTFFNVFQIIIIVRKITL